MAKNKIRHIVTGVHETFRQLLPPYEDYHSSGPYLRKEKDGNRWCINILKTANDGFFGVLYARYLLEVKLGRPLRNGYEVDHIDGCKWNDRIDNLQELSHEDNLRKGRNDILNVIQHAKVYVNVKCPECGTWFEKKRSMMLGKLAFCSRHCNGKYHSRTDIPKDYVQETKDIPMPDLSSLPGEYHEPFENVSTEYTCSKRVLVCNMCGKPLPHNGSIHCQECIAKNKQEQHMVEDQLCQRIVDEMKTMYATEGKVVMTRLSKKFGYSDTGLAKILTRHFNKPYRDVIKEVCDS